ncbi:YdeI/OmpD-associated family protein [Neobacillus sp. SuZ13]|uniref:YdeI/OmpD-associated family protein n=1 Tax=Neobacillus sp. SuZ13 TaxID=3047875 RepID=UPI0024BFFB71|nr:YdeI/OmpD-associated family protein [Neobacillus sp. SuZ13]WHY64865.1 YdeI/OmpD-associated family protein [Neobacillus sp. SuZ13]
MNSPKTIVEKLNLSKYDRKLVLNKPEDLDELNGLNYDSTPNKEKYDLIFCFVFSLEEFSQQLKSVIDNQLLEKNGYIFFAYPKKNNPKYQEYIERDSLFEAVAMDEEGYTFGSDIKFSRMVSLNDVFTVVGLKSTPKKVKKIANSKSSQCVDDYIIHVDDIKQYLNRNEELLASFNQLTFGYQKDWARYVYSAKRKETQEKRLLEMETVLGEGYKTMDLYRRKQK